MSPATHHGRSPGKGRSLVVLVTLALAASSLIAYQAVRAHRMHGERAAATLDDYALFAAWELSRNASETLRHAVNMTLWPVNRVGVLAGDSLPPASVLEAAQGREMECDCPIALAARYFFRLDLRTGAVESAGEVVSPPLAEALLEVARTRIGDLMQPDWRGMLLEVPARGERHLLAAVVLPDGQGAPRAMYGIAVEPGVLGPLFAEAWKERPLLPHSLAAGRPADSLMVVTLHSAGGRELYRSPGEPSVHAAVQSLPPSLGDLRVGVALRNDVLSAFGTMPDSQTPLLLLLLLGTGVVFALVVRDVERRTELAMLRSDFVASVSHELRTPLAQIRMFSETLALKRERSEEERGRFLGIVQGEAERLSHLVENVLRFARGRKDGDDAPGHASCEVSGVLSAVAEVFERLAAARHATLELSLPDARWASIDGDELRQVMVNLVDNALKYGPPGQTVRIGAAPARDGGVEIRVEDEGPGVPRAERERIFRPFTRGRGHPPSVTGTGIGLTVVRDLVRARRGRVAVEDRASGGASFVVTLPGAAPLPEVRPSAAAELAG